MGGILHYITLFILRLYLLGQNMAIQKTSNVNRAVTRNSSTLYVVITKVITSQ